VRADFRILGPLEVLLDGTPAPLGGARQKAVLAVLLLHANESVSVERLIDNVWEDEPPETARNVLQSYVSQLRKLLGADVIRMRGQGYTLEIDPERLDLHRFQRLVGETEGRDPASTAERLRAALALWRGPPLADLPEGAFARATAARLEELRVAALERRLEADMSLGRAPELVAELEALVAEHPLRERLRALQMLALYRSGRQADALQAFRAARSRLVDELGIEPAPALQQLERAILRHDPALDPPPAAGLAEAVADPLERSILVAARESSAVIPLCLIAEPLARQPVRELIVVRVLDEGGDPAPSSAQLAGLRDELSGRGLAMRVAAYTSPAPGDDVALLATEQEVDLLLVDAPPELLEHGVPDPELAVILRDAPCDVAVLVNRGGLHREAAHPVVVPFGGGEHDWSAVELAGWTARALGTTLLLVGTSADRFRGRRDASRLLARVSLIVQAVVGIVAEPVLVRPGPSGVLAVAADASLLVVGLSGRWRSEGLGEARLDVARATGVPTLLVRKGLRPGGLAPKQSMTRFTWTLEPEER